MNMKTLSGIVIVLLRILWIVLNNFYTIPACLVWMLLIQPIRLVWPSIYWKIEGKVFNGMLGQAIFWVNTAGYKVYESGADLSPYFDDAALVIVNHQSTADVPIIMKSFSAKEGVCAGMMWIMDRILMYTDFGWISLIHGDFFIQQGTKTGRTDQMNLLENHINTTYQARPRKWIVLFPEGGFLRKRLAGSQRYAKKNDLPVLTHVTLPRLGAVQTIMHNLHPDNNENGNKRTIKHVIDMTIAYPDGKPLDAMRLMGGYEDPLPTQVYFRVFPIRDVPSTGEDLQNWLYNVFVEKERLLGDFYETGHFDSKKLGDGNVGEVVKEREVTYSSLYLFGLNVFYMCSTVVQYYTFKSLYNILF